MKHAVTLIVASALLVAAAHADVLHVPAPFPTLQANIDIEHDARTPVAARGVTIEARVARADGSPAAGAVVVSSAGGQGVADEAGVAHLEVSISPDAEAVHMTAATTEAGVTSAGSVRAGVIGETDLIDAGAITLADGGECVPKWIPTFGGASGLNNTVRALTVFDDGSGPALHAGGSFLTAGGETVNRIVKWDGASWSPLLSGVSGSGVPQVFALKVFDDGSGPALYAGGSFTVSPVGDSFIARWQGCLQSNPADFNGDGAVNGADLATLLANWGPCPPAPDPCPADLNDDGTVNGADLAQLLANWTP